MANTGEVWLIADGEDAIAAPTPQNSENLYRPEVLETIEESIDEISSKLHALSLDIHDHPEIKFKEFHAHDVLTAFMRSQGFKVTTSYHLPTAWLATYTHRASSCDDAAPITTLGINSEMDALPDIGHACGHNLIAIAGVAVACAVKAALKKWDITGRIELLGTPAEEVGHGKDILLEKGAYENMAVCLICHPTPGPRGSVSLNGSLALQNMYAEYSGHSAHASLSPWEGRNALDAAVMAYNGISVLRQQLKRTHRVHAIFLGAQEGKSWAVNIVPDSARMQCIVRAPESKEIGETVERVLACFDAAAIATGCTVKIKKDHLARELRQNKVLGDELATIVRSKYGDITYGWGIGEASTDFGSVGYTLPSLHPCFAIPIQPNGGNHTPAFADSARAPVAHDACMTMSKALAALGVRVLSDAAFLDKVTASFKAEQELLK